MLYANLNNERIRAPKENKEKGMPAVRAICPFCNAEVLAKCGNINIHHWAHINNIDCRHEPETDWHRNWKNIAEQHGFEIEKNFNTHVADAYTSDEIIEFQHSNISSDEILERCEFYKEYAKRVSWIFGYLKREHDNGIDHFSKYKTILDIYDRIYKVKIKPSLLCLFDDDGNPKYGSVYFQFDDDVIVQILKILDKKNFISGIAIKPDGVFNSPLLILSNEIREKENLIFNLNNKLQQETRKAENEISNLMNKINKNKNEIKERNKDLLELENKISKADIVLSKLENKKKDVDEEIKYILEERITNKLDKKGFPAICELYSDKKIGGNLFKLWMESLIKNSKVRNLQVGNYIISIKK